MNPETFKRIGRPARNCMACEATLHDVGHHPSVLRDELDDSPEGAPARREDYCPSCWKELASEGYFSFWLARRDPARPPIRIERERRNRTLLDWLVELDGGSPEGDAAPLPEEPLAQSLRARRPFYVQRLRRYLLAHVLHQYHAIEWVGEIRDPQSPRRRRLVFFVPTVERRVEVEDCDPTPEEIEAVRTEIRHHLERQSSLSPFGAATRSSPA